MPLIEVTVPRGAFEPAVAEKLLDELAGTLLRWEGAPDTEFFRGITWVYLNEIDPARLAVGGRPGGTPRYKIDVTVPQGALPQERKDGLIADVHAAITAVAPDVDPLHIWTLVREVPEGSWGAGGQAVRFADLKQIAGAERAAAS